MSRMMHGAQSSAPRRRAAPPPPPPVDASAGEDGGVAASGSLSARLSQGHTRAHSTASSSVEASTGTPTSELPDGDDIPSHCTNCEERPPRMLCRACQEYLCRRCHRVLHKRPKLRGHPFVALSAAASPLGGSAATFASLRSTDASPLASKPSFLGVTPGGSLLVDEHVEHSSSSDSDASGDSGAEEPVASLHRRRKGTRGATAGVLSDSWMGGGGAGGSSVAGSTAVAHARFVLPQAEVEVGDMVGEGFFGVVYRGRWRGHEVALKRLKSDAAMRGAALDATRKEVAVLCQLRHPCVLHFYGVTNGVDAYIVSEFMSGGSLAGLLHNRKDVAVSGRLAMRLARDVAMGVAYLHSLEPPIVHRDITSSNVLLASDAGRLAPLIETNVPLAKVCDFGLSREVEWYMTQGAGNLFYLAPEVTRGEHYRESADTFSFGVLLWEVVCRRVPYGGVNPQTAAFKVAAEGLRPPLEPLRERVAADPDLPDALPRLVQRCWAGNVALRPRMEDVAEMLRGDVDGGGGGGASVGDVDVVVAPIEEEPTPSAVQGAELPEEAAAVADADIERVIARTDTVLHPYELFLDARRKSLASDDGNGSDPVAAMVMAAASAAERERRYVKHREIVAKMRSAPGNQPGGRGARLSPPAEGPVTQRAQSDGIAPSTGARVKAGRRDRSALHRPGRGGAGGAQKGTVWGSSFLSHFDAGDGDDDEPSHEAIKQRYRERGDGESTVWGSSFLARGEAAAEEHEDLESLLSGAAPGEGHRGRAERAHVRRPSMRALGEYARKKEASRGSSTRSLLSSRGSDSGDEAVAGEVEAAAAAARARAASDRSEERAGAHRVVLARNGSDVSIDRAPGEGSITLDIAGEVHTLAGRGSFAVGRSSVPEANVRHWSSVGRYIGVQRGPAADALAEKHPHFFITGAAPAEYRLTFPKGNAFTLVAGDRRRRSAGVLGAGIDFEFERRTPARMLESDASVTLSEGDAFHCGDFTMRVVSVTPPSGD